LIFRNPFAWIGLVALVVPVVIHLLVRAPAQPIVLASLRFVPTSPMRALRRRLLNDAALLALRLTVLALAVAAFADPLATTACRRAAWNTRVARAVIADPRAEPAAIERTRREPAAIASSVITGEDLAGGLARALVWLDAAPPARREVVFVAPLELGAVDASMLRQIPASAGIRFVRTSAPTATSATLSAPRVTAGDAAQRLLARVSPITLDGERLVIGPGVTTPLGDETIASAPHGWQAPVLGLSLVGPESARPALRAALTAAIVVGVPIPSNPTARPIVVAVDPGGAIEGFAPAVTGTPSPWMADVTAALAADAALAHTLRGAKAIAADAMTDPWRVVLRDDDGGVLAAMAATPPAIGADREPSGVLVVRARVAPTSTALPAMVRSVLVASAEGPARSKAEVLRIPDAQLAAWTRPAGEIDDRAIGAPQASDRAWLWAAALVALAAEALVRRRRLRTPSAAQESGSHDRAA
jgi:hypothetical protein